MQLNESEYGIGTLHKDGEFHDALIITKSALERLRKEYHQQSVAWTKRGALAMSTFIKGKVDLLEDLLKLFDE